MEEKSIIEKLGITASPWSFRGEIHSSWEILDRNKKIIQSDEQYYPWNSDNKADWVLQASAPEMLESHINIVQLVEGVRNGNLSSEMFVNMVEGISLYRCEKATNKSWDEIKELL